MGKKIHSNLFRQYNIFTSLQKTSKFFLVQKRFLHEIEVRWFLSHAFSQKSIGLQDIFYEQSFSKGFLVRLDFISLSNLAFCSLKKPKQSKKLVSKIKVLSSSSLRFQTRRNFNNKEKILRSYSLNDRARSFRLVGATSVPFFLSNKNLREFLLLVHRLLQRFQTLENFLSLILIVTLGLSFPGFLGLFLTSLVRVFFKSRRHSIRLKFLRRLIVLVFKNNRNFSRVTGFLMQLAGRLDKKPRAESYKISLGKLQRQSFVGTLVSKNLQSITKNGAFGIFVCFRFSG